MPVIATGPKGSNIWDLGGQAPVLISGPYLVRDATILGPVLALTGDLNATVSTPITVFAPSSIKILTWNGKPVLGATRSKNGPLTATLPASLPKYSLPDLHSLNWLYADSLPEISPTFNAAKTGLIKADKTKTNNPFQPYYGGPWVLYASDYGFHVNSVHFLSCPLLIRNIRRATCSGVARLRIARGSLPPRLSISQYLAEITLPSLLGSTTTILVRSIIEFAPATRASLSPTSIYAMEPTMSQFYKSEPLVTLDLTTSS